MAVSPPTQPRLPRQPQSPRRSPCFRLRRVLVTQAFLPVSPSPPSPLLPSTAIAQTSALLPTPARPRNTGILACVPLTPITPATLNRDRPGELPASLPAKGPE